MRISNPRLLLVEGPDERHVIGHLLAHHGIPEGLIAIYPENGIEALLQSLPNWLIGTTLERCGIIVDANTHPERRWQSVRDVLMANGYTRMPLAPSAGGTIVEQEQAPSIGIWMMPNNASSGMLEDFVGSLIQRSDRLWARARRSVDTIPDALRRFPPEHRRKAHIHTWLAWQEQPGTPMGSAIRQRYLDADAPDALRLIDWIRRLFAV